MAVTYAASSATVYAKIELRVLFDGRPLPNLGIDLLVTEENGQIFVD